MTTLTAPAPQTRRAPWGAVAGAAIVVVAVVLAVGTGFGPGRDAAVDEALLFLDGFDGVSAELAADRSTVAAATGEVAAEGFTELAGAVSEAGTGYAELDPPELLAPDMATYLDALEAEELATIALREAVAAGEDPTILMQELLDRRAEADNLQRAVRRSAEALTRTAGG